MTKIKFTLEVEANTPLHARAFGLAFHIDAAKLVQEINKTAKEVGINAKGSALLMDEVQDDS